MNETTPDHARLLDEAIDLIIRYQNDPDNPVTGEMIRAWRLRSRDHEEAWSGVATVYGASGKILAEKRRLERRDSLVSTRRTLVFGGISLLGAGAAAYSFGPGLLLRARADYVTTQAEIRQLALPDGSMATLGPQSAIALNFSKEHRSLELLAGMSFFEVSRDPARPFSVRSGTMHAVATEAAFDMSNDADVLSVSVDHGLVDVGGADLAAKPIVSLTAEEWATIDPSSGMIDRGQREAGQIASWRNRIIIAERETVYALTARIGRWMSGRIIIADPSIGRQRVSGVFDLSDPRGALQAAVHPTGARLRQITPFITLVSPV